MAQASLPPVTGSVFFNETLGVWPLHIIPNINYEYWDTTRLGAHVGWLEYTGWFDDPLGNTVLAAHYTLANGAPGPFWTLSKVPLGALVLVNTPARVYVFQVARRFVVSPFDVAVTFRVPGQTTLTLVTCADWNPLTQSYSERLVVQGFLVN